MTTTAIRYRTDRYEKVKRAKARRGGERPDRRRRMTDEQLVAHIKKIRAEHPDSPEMVELRYAQYVTGLAFSDARWHAAWRTAGKELRAGARKR